MNTMIESTENNEKTKHASQAPVTYDNNGKQLLVLPLHSCIVENLELNTYD